MNKNVSIIIVAIAIILIIVGGYLIITNQSNGDVNEDSSQIPLKKQDFKLFEMNVPQDSNFTIKNDNDGMRFYQNGGKYSGNFSGIIVSKNLTDDLIGDNSHSISNSSSENIYSSEFKNQTIYKFVSNQGDVDFILIGNDLNLLKEISDSIKVKNLEDI